MSGDKTALFRNGRDLRDVKLSEPTNVEELLACARHGDTLHNIPEAQTHSSDDVLRTVREQLVTGQCVPV